MKKDTAFNCVREEIKKDIASNCDCGLTGGCTKCNFCWEESEEKQTPQDWETFLEYALPGRLTEEEKRIIRNNVSALLARQKQTSKERSKHWPELVEILEEQFPKGKCKERGAALVLLAHSEMALKEQVQEIRKEESEKYAKRLLDLKEHATDELKEEIKRLLK